MTRVLTVLLCACCATGLAAQDASAPATHSGAFIARLGKDTLTVERFQRTGGAYSVEQVLHVPRTALRHTHLELSPDGEIGTVMYMHHQIGGASDAPLLASTTLTFPSGDSARVETKRGDSTQARTVAARRTMVPSLPESWLPYEIAAMRMRASGSDSSRMRFLQVSGNATPVTVRTLGADSMTFELSFTTYRAHVTPDGQVRTIYQPNGVRIERVPTIDINGIAARWDALDRQGQAMGPLSPLDSSAISLGDGQVVIVYSRPSARGRTIWGDLVPWNEVWRTGANAATVLRTTRDLTIGGMAVPAGSYTLFTISTPTETRLIVNRETMRDGRPLAGTDYILAHDLARIPMSIAVGPSAVEQFTISIEPGTGSQATLVIAWDRRRMTVPVVGQ